jgi:hypothetical protein
LFPRIERTEHSATRFAISGNVILDRLPSFVGGGQRRRSAIILGPAALDQILPHKPVDGGRHGRHGDIKIAGDIADATTGIFADEHQRLSIQCVERIVSGSSRFSHFESARELLESARKPRDLFRGRFSHVAPKHVRSVGASKLAKLAQHPCLSFLIKDGNDPWTKPSRARELPALLAVIDHDHKNLAAYAEPQPLSRAFDAMPDMPRSTRAR